MLVIYRPIYRCPGKVFSTYVFMARIFHDTALTKKYIQIYRKIDTICFGTDFQKRMKTGAKGEDKKSADGGHEARAHAVATKAPEAHEPYM